MRLTAEQQQTVSDNVKFAYHLANKWADKQSAIDREELIGIASEALCRAVCMYDPDRGCGLASFAKRHINHTISKAIRDKLCRDRIENDATHLQGARLKEKTSAR